MRTKALPVAWFLEELRRYGRLPALKRGLRSDENANADKTKDYCKNGTATRPAELFTAHYKGHEYVNINSE